MDLLMPYFPVDDDMAFHPKILAAGNDAIGMWARAGALCKKYTTGGFVSTDTARSLGPKRLADKLVSAGLWTVADGGYQFHDWKHQAGNYDAQEEKDRAERARQSNAARQAAYRARNTKSNAVTEGVRNAESTRPPIPIPKESSNELSPAPAPRMAENDFERAYSHWPKKVERKAAFERFKVAARKRGLEQLIADVIRFGDAYAATTDRKFVPALGVWLSGERWSDELPSTQRPAQETGGRREELIDGIRFVNGKPTVGGPQGMTSAQYRAWQEQRESRRGA